MEKERLQTETTELSLDLKKKGNNIYVFLFFHFSFHIEEMINASARRGVLLNAGCDFIEL